MMFGKTDEFNISSIFAVPLTNKDSDNFNCQATIRY